jgi:hypothetical protein
MEDRVLRQERQQDHDEIAVLRLRVRELELLQQLQQQRQQQAPSTPRATENTSRYLAGQAAKPTSAPEPILLPKAKKHAEKALPKPIAKKKPAPIGARVKKEIVEPVEAESPPPGWGGPVLLLLPHE